MDLRIIDFPEYPWKTLNVHEDFSYTFNISPGKKIEGDLFDSSKMKAVSYNKDSHVQILAVCDPYGPPFYVRRDIDGLLWSSWVKIEEEHFWQEINGCSAAIKSPPLCTSHYYF